VTKLLKSFLTKESIKRKGFLGKNTTYTLLSDNNVYEIRYYTIAKLLERVG